MGQAARPIQVRDLVLLVAVAVIPMTLARWEAIGPFGVFAVSTVMLAAITTVLVIRSAADLVRRDLAHPIAAIFVAVATPLVCVVIVLWAIEHWTDAVTWLRRWRMAILGAGSCMQAVSFHDFRGRRSVPG
jgi:hypothetical protein